MSGSQVESAGWPEIARLGDMPRTRPASVRSTLVIAGGCSRRRGGKKRGKGVRRARRTHAGCCERTLRNGFGERKLDVGMSEKTRIGRIGQTSVRTRSLFVEGVGMQYPIEGHRVLNGSCSGSERRLEPAYSRMGRSISSNVRTDCRREH